MNEDEREEIGQVADTLDNLLHAALLPVSPAIHVQGLTGGIREVLSRLRKLLDREG